MEWNLMTSKVCGLGSRVLVVLAVFAGGGCLGRGPVEVGPIRVTTDAGEGSMARDFFLRKGLGPITFEQDFCEFPSEEDLSREALQVGGIDIRHFVRMSGLDLVQTRLAATRGDFKFIRAITVSFVPAADVGEDPDSVVLGTASSANGLGDRIRLVPTGGVDLLELIRENDANTSGNCPKLRYEVTFSAPPLTDVDYAIDITVDGYVEVGRF